MAIVPDDGQFFGLAIGGKRGGFHLNREAAKRAKRGFSSRRRMKLRGLRFFAVNLFLRLEVTCCFMAME
jgi:hypothetical protein